MLLASTLRRAAGLALAGVLCTGSLTGCSGDEPGADTAPSESASASEPPTEGAPYLAVPGRVELTEPGTALRLGESAVVAWQPRQDEVAAIDLTVDLIRRTTFEESFQGWQVDQETSKNTPYFVHATAKALSGDDLGGASLPLYASEGGEKLLEPVGFGGTFTPCPGNSLPERFHRGDQVPLCLVYLIEPGKDLQTVSFLPLAGLEPITWSGKVTDDQPPKPDQEQG